MNTVLGPFHPDLEQALAEEVRKRKSDDPLSTLLILVPSDSLRRRLKISLAAEQRLALLNVYVLTFHQLYLRLLEERQIEPPLLIDDLMVEEALAHWIKIGGAETAPFLTVGENAGGCGALWQTLRDLKDGGVHPAHLRAALAESLFDRRDKDKLVMLVALYESFTEALRRWGLHDYADFVSAARDCVPSSPFLTRMEQIFAYGFYDLTQVQLDFFHEMARHYPATVFFPLVRAHSAWVFAERFYERHLQGLAGAETSVLAGSGSASLPLFADETCRTAIPANPPRCAIISCSLPRDEIVTAAKEILRLSRDEGLAYPEIGIVARTLEPYGRWIKEVFRDHRIPVSTSAEDPLLDSPLAKALMLLLELAAKDYLRGHFVDLVSSPFFNLRALTPEDLVPRPDFWDILTRRLGITKGAEQWARLKPYLGRDFEFTVGEEDSHEQTKISVPAAQVAILWRLFTELNRDLSALPTEASWSQYAGLWHKLAQKYLALPGGSDLDGEAPNQNINMAILETLADLAALDAIEPKTSLRDFIQTWERRLGRKSLPLSEQNINGVAVLDAMAARGARFRALFILGLNEGLFPRTVREDAFLRDRPRRVMETVLGYKVSEKLAGFDEEKLLFTLLVSAASDRLYCLYQRADDAGRALEPSWYLAELERALSGGGAEITKTMIPRGIWEKKDAEPFRSGDFLLPEELAIRLGLAGEDPEPLFKHLPQAKALYQNGSKLLAVLEEADAGLSIYDGVTGHVDGYWRYLLEHGLAPTALERYGRCPFQFFATNLLGLRPLERPETQLVVGSSEIGKLIHEILKVVFQEMIDSGFFTGAATSLDLDPLLEAVARKVFRQYEAENPVGYQFLWEIVQAQVLELARVEIQRDLQELKRSGRRPVALELHLEGALPSDWPWPAGGLPIHGTVDRIDLDPGNDTCRVVDYKFTMRNRPSQYDTNLPLAAARGQKLQPPIYILLAKEHAPGPLSKQPSIEAAFHYLAPKWNERHWVQIFSEADLEGSLGASLRETVAGFIRGIHEGLYFIRPGEACRNCEVAHVCRKNHLPTAWRAANDPSTEAHERLVKKTLAKE